MIKGFKELIVWQKAMDAAAEVYRLAKCLPREELQSLGNQMRRAAVSVPSNIAEGFGRASKKDYAKSHPASPPSQSPPDLPLYAGSPSVLPPFDPALSSSSPSFPFPDPWD